MLIDASDGIVDQDLRILNLIRGYGKPVVVALNKIDELSGDSLSNLKETKKFQNSALNELILVEISALQKRGFKKPIEKVHNPTNKVVPYFFPLA